MVPIYYIYSPISLAGDIVCRKSPNSDSWDGKYIDISDTAHFSGIFCLVLVWQRGSDEFIDNSLKYCILCVHFYW